MTLEALLLIASALAADASTWSPEQKENMERCREFCRTTLTHIGLAECTRCLADLWVVLTMAQVKMAGFEGRDINIAGMGLPKQNFGVSLDRLKSMNRCMLKLYKEDLAAMDDFAIGLIRYDAEWAAQVQDLLEEIVQTVS